MKVAVAKATLQVPPTYFAVQHAIALRDRFDFRFFAAAGDVREQAVVDALAIEDASRGIPLLGSRSYALRQRAAPLLSPLAARAIARWEPDLIHQHFANLSGAAVSAHRRLHVPLVLTVHGADVFVPLAPASSRRGMARVLLPVHRRTVRRGFAEADVVLAVSEYLADRAVAAGADPGKVQVHYQGIDTELYSPSGVHTRDEPPVIAFVGALSEAKGVRDLVAASRSLLPTCPHQLVLAGDGPLRGELDAAARTDPHIRVLGRVDRERVRELLDGAAVLALPTREWKGAREAAGLVTLEAQAMCVPVVVYDSGGAREMFEDGRTGVLVREGDVAALAEGIRQIVALPAGERAAMGRRAREFVVAHRSLAVSADELARHYEEATR